MREYRFRIFHEGRMFYKTLTGIYWETSKKCKTSGLFKASSQDNQLPIMEFTGMKDINGIKIWEGDIVKDDNGCIGEIEYDNEIAAFVYKPLSDKTQHNLFLGNKFTCFEVIGNIHQDENLTQKGA